MKKSSRIENIEKEEMEVVIDYRLIQLCSRCYQALGWVILSTRPRGSTIKLTLERNKKIVNRSALYQLQHRCEDAFMELEKLHKLESKKKYDMNTLKEEVSRNYDIIYLACEAAEKLS